MKQLILSRSIHLVAVASLAFAGAALAQNKLPEIKTDPAPLQRTPQNSYAPIVEKVAPSVVTISINELRAAGDRRQRAVPLPEELRRYFGIPDDEPADRRNRGNGPKRPTQIGLGSGVIVSADGYILTNNHVVETGDEIIVTLADGKTEYKAKKIGGDAGSDVAVIKVEATGLTPVTFSDSDKLKVGDLALAIGNPFALRQSVTMGIISATGRTETGISEFGNFIQTDAAINPGNSGGALVDTEGRLIGINSAIFSRTGGNMGIGFAVPSNQARSVMESLIKFGKVQRGALGIRLQPLDEKFAGHFKVPVKTGIVVTEVLPGGGAEKAGVKIRDVIVSVNGRPVTEIQEFITSVAEMAPGTKVEVKFYRPVYKGEEIERSEEKTLAITLTDRAANSLAGTPTPEVKPPDKAPDVLDGVTVADIRGEIRQRFGIPETVKGALVTDVDPDSPCADAEVRPGDVIIEIEGKAVKSAEDAIELSKQVKAKGSVILRVSSRGATRFVIVEERKE